MTKATPTYYAVRIGRIPGVYLTWDECAAQVNGYPGNVFKKFSTLEEAQEFVGRGSHGEGTTPVMMGWVAQFGHYPTSQEI